MNAHMQYTADIARGAHFTDLARLDALPAAQLLGAASDSLALAASLTDSRRNMKLATKALGL